MPGVEAARIRAWMSERQTSINVGGAGVSVACTAELGSQVNDGINALQSVHI